MTLIYKGPRSSATVNIDGQAVDVALIPGKAPEGLPEDHPYALTLKAGGHLEEAPSAPSKASKSTKSTTPQEA